MSSVRVLIAEPEGATALHLRQLLVNLGHEVVGTVSGSRGAVAVAESARPDVVLLDIGLSKELDGLAAMCALRRVNPSIVLLAPGLDDAVAQQVARTNAEGLLVKPVGLDSLREALRSALCRRRIESDRCGRSDETPGERTPPSETPCGGGGMPAKVQQVMHSQRIEAMGQLAGGVAHDFNNLLTIIGGYGDMLLARGNLDDATRSYLQEIRDATERAASLTRQLLIFSRRQIVEPRVLDLNAVVSDLDKLLRRLIGEDVELITRLQSGLPCVRADACQLEQVIMNLSINARDAMPQGGRLELETASAPDGTVRLTVRDNGCGMAEDVRDRIFEPFYSTKEPGRGTGLGLSTVYGIVQQAGGRIEVRSAPGEGSCFHVLLPATHGETPSGALEKARPSATGGTETILVVEDDERVRRMVRHILERNGYRVLSTSGGAEAVRACEEFPDPIHLLLTDTVMPGMSGPEVAERVRGLRPEVLVLFMSGYTDDAMARHGLNIESVHFLGKPFKQAALLAAVREVVEAPALAVS